MAKLLVAYHTRTEHTAHMAEAICAAAQGVDGAETELKRIAGVQPRELLEYDGIVLGSPTYYGLLSAEIKQLLDATVEFHGQLSGKVGAAFASSANVGGGNETTVLSSTEPAGSRLRR